MDKSQDKTWIAIRPRRWPRHELNLMLNLLRDGYYRLAGLPLLGGAIRHCAPAVKRFAESMAGRAQGGLRLEQMESQLAAARMNLNASLALNPDYARFCPAISLIICTCDREESLREALGVAQRLIYPKLELICVNGPSQDGTRRLLEKWPGDLKIRDCPQRNISMARNIGVAAASGEIVAFMDDDAIPRQDWLMELARTHANESAAAVGGFIRDASGVNWQARVCVADRFGDGRQYSGLSEALGREGTPEKWLKNAGAKQRMEKYFSPTGTNMSFKRSALLAIGGFDENYAYHLDETDVFLRLADAGYKTAFNGLAEVTHKMANSGNRNSNGAATCLYQKAKSKTYFAMRHALPFYGQEMTRKRLDAWLAWLRSQMESDYRQGKLAREEFERLGNELEAGKRDGEKLASACKAETA